MAFLEPKVRTLEFIFYVFIAKWCRTLAIVSFFLIIIFLNILYIIFHVAVLSLSYLTYIKLCTLVKRNESMAHTLQAKLKEPESDENKRGPRPQDLIRLYDIILQVSVCILKLNWQRFYTFSDVCSENGTGHDVMSCCKTPTSFVAGCKFVTCFLAKLFKIAWGMWSLKQNINP